METSDVSYFDTHAHLTLLTHTQGEDAWERAKAANIRELVTVSTEESNWVKNREFAKRYEGIYYSVGVHPHETDDWKSVRPRMESFLSVKENREKCVAIGEMGLDFHFNHAARENQIESFEEQLDLAVQWKLPLIIHCRDAFTDIFEILVRKGIPEKGAVFHCFTGGVVEAKQAADLGIYLSLSGILTFKTAQTIREAARNAPRELLLIETDCPYLAPIPHRGKPNEPLFLPETARCLATVCGMSLEETARLTTANARRFFSILT